MNSAYTIMFLLNNELASAGPDRILSWSDLGQKGGRAEVGDNKIRATISQKPEESCISRSLFVFLAKWHTWLITSLYNRTQGSASHI